MSDQQVRLLQEYISCLERENSSKNKERQTLYMQMQQLQRALKQLQQEVIRVKMTQSIIYSYQQTGQLRQRINELQSEIEILKFEQKHLFEQNLSLISALEGTVNQNTELQQQNLSLKLQKQELEKFRVAIQRINASLQELEAERIQLTEANTILVEENSYLKGILAASRSGYMMFQQASNPNSPQHNNSHKVTQKNFHPQNLGMIKSSYLMSSSFQKISQNEQEQEVTSTQGEGSIRRKKTDKRGSTGKKGISSTQLIQGQRPVQYPSDDGDFIVEQSVDVNINNLSSVDEENIINNNNQDSSYLMMMDSKEESLRVSWDVQKENIECDKNGKEGFKIANFEKAIEKQDQVYEQEIKSMKCELRTENQEGRHSTQVNKNSDESSCDVVQQQLPLSQISHYQQRDTNKPTPSICLNQLQPPPSSLIHLSQPPQQSQNPILDDRVQQLLIINSELQQELSQLKEQLMQISNQKDNLYQQLYRREEQERENCKEWEGKINQITCSYNAVVQHAERLEDQNVMYKNRVSQLQEIIKSYNRKNTNLNSSQRSRSNNMVSSSSRENRFSRHVSDNKSRFMMSVGREQDSRGVSIVSVQEPRQVDNLMNQVMQKSKKPSKQHLVDSYQSDYNKQNEFLNTNYLQGSLTRDSGKFNYRSNQKLFNQSLTEYDHCYQDGQQSNSEIKQVQNRLQQRILRIKSQNQILLKQLQLF